MNKVKFLLATLFITLTASLSYAADIKGTDFKKDGISYEINSDGNTVTVLFGPITGNLVIPSTVENNGKTYTITAIAAMAFYECPDLKSVTLPATLTSIGNSAFALCSQITSVTLPESLKSIGESAFSGCAAFT